VNSAGRDPWLLAGLSASALLLAWPVLSVRWVPYLDLPQHVGAVAILSGTDPAWRLGDYYDVDLLGSPYLLPYLLASGLAMVVGAATAVKAMFALAAATLPLSLAYAARRFGRDPRIGLFAAPLAYGTFAFMGFLNFVLSLPLWLLWLGWWREAVDRPRFGWPQWLIGGVLSVLLFYGHVMTLGFAAGCCAVIAVLARGPEREGSAWRELGTRSLRALHFLPGVALFVAWATLSRVSQEGELGRMLGARAAAAPPHWPAPLDALKTLLDHLLSAYRGTADEALLLATVALVGLLMVLRKRDGRAAERPNWRADRAVGLLLLSALGLAVALPDSYRGIWPIGARMAPFVALLVLLLPKGRIIWPRAAVVLGIMLTATTSVVHARAFARFQDEVGELDAAIAAIEPGHRTMALIFDKGSAVVRSPVFLHYSQYVLAEKGGVAEFSFCNFTKSPIHYAQTNAPPRNPVRFEWTPQRFDWAGQRAYWDYVLVRGHRHPAAIFGGDRSMRVAQQSARWTLYRKRR